MLTRAECLTAMAQGVNGYCAAALTTPAPRPPGTPGVLLESAQQGETERAKGRRISRCGAQHRRALRPREVATGQGEVEASLAPWPVGLIGRSQERHGPAQPCDSSGDAVATCQLDESTTAQQVTRHDDEEIGSPRPVSEPVQCGGGGLEDVVTPAGGGDLIHAVEGRCQFGYPGPVTQHMDAPRSGPRHQAKFSQAVEDPRW